MILVVDIEATCWRGRPPPGEENEIIEVGCCLLDPATGERTDKAALMVRPERSTVSYFCTELTTITPEDVAAAPTFAETCAELVRRYRAPELVWASYGAYDRRQFQHQCEARGVPYPFGPRHINVKRLFMRTFGFHKDVGMSRALEKLGRPLEGTHHRGVDDAWNIAAILDACLRGQGVSIDDALTYAGPKPTGPKPPRG